MGSICSPDYVDPAIEPNVDPNTRKKSKQNGFIEESATETHHSTSHELDGSQKNESSTTKGLDADLLDDHDELSYSKSNTDVNPIEIDHHQQQQQQQSDTQQKGFQIVVTPADTTNSETTDNNSQDELEKSQEFRAKNKAKVDPTLGGKIVWLKVADFAALLPENVKLKLWNGVFKEKEAEKTEEVKRISKVLRTFVMLQLTRVQFVCLCEYAFGLMN